MALCSAETVICDKGLLARLRERRIREGGRFGEEKERG